jgi:hypothetical protein
MDSTELIRPTQLWKVDATLSNCRASPLDVAEHMGRKSRPRLCPHQHLRASVGCDPYFVPHPSSGHRTDRSPFEFRNQRAQEPRRASSRSREAQPRPRAEAPRCRSASADGTSAVGQMVKVLALRGKSSSPRGTRKNSADHRSQFPGALTTCPEFQQYSCLTFAQAGRAAD